jgi:protein tyrosine phosphatase (PTP) superfamily phosphohydrolase (DUF442 family)
MPSRAIAAAWLALASLGAILLAACSGNEAHRLRRVTAAGPGPRVFSAIDSPDLHNAHRVTDDILSGAQPEGDAGFKALADLGVRTIISVDGARPDVAGAAKHGLTYVHLPIGYDGVGEQQGLAIAKAMRELPGPIYVHCHHGRHRSAAAVAVACVYGGSLAPAHAEDVLRTFGTGENYTGLWTAARRARPRDPGQLDALRVDFVPIAKVPPLAEAMVLLDHHWEHLRLIQKNDWRAPREHPDLAPAHEALQLQEHFQELARTEEVKARPAEFRRLLGDSIQASSELREALAATPVEKRSTDAAVQRIAVSCSACHKAYRD